MRQIISSAVNVLDLAASLSGVPYVGAAAGLLNDIITTCDEIRVQKKAASRIRDKCVQLMLFLEEQSSKLEGTDLLEALDEAANSLQTIRTRLQKLTRSNSLSLFLKSTDAADTLARCESDLDTTTTLLNMKFVHLLPCSDGGLAFTKDTRAQMSIASSQRDVKDIVTSSRAELSEVRELLTKLFSSQLETEQLVALRNRDNNLAGRLMEAGQQALHDMKGMVTSPELTTLPGSGPPSAEYDVCRDALFNFHLSTGTLPTIKVLDDEITLTGDLAVAGGTYSDIWLGKWMGRRTVALKALRNIKANDPKARQRFEHEIQLWSGLENNHILPFYGIVTNIGRRIHIVSPWQENGNVLGYIKGHPTADRFQLIKGAACGLEYLHANNIVHGNVKCTNILVTEKIEACICDFGMSKLVEEVTEKNASATLTATGSARWLAPELIEGSITSPTFATDTYSFAMAILELLTGKYPFAERKRDASVIHDIVVQKKVPQRPKDPAVTVWMTDEVWGLLERCWKREPTLRPRMGGVKVDLESIMK